MSLETQTAKRELGKIDPATRKWNYLGDLEGRRRGKGKCVEEKGREALDSDFVS